jgi:Aspartyl/Asparaginyl beta-hydroxylase
MFYEKLGFEVNIKQLRKDIETHVFTAGPQYIQGKEFESKQYNGFGGWSLLSRTGEYTDGWEVFHADDPELKEIIFPNGTFNYKAMKYMGVSDPMEHKNPTSLYVGEIKRVIDQLTYMGFYPRRVRVTCLKAGSKSLVHQDCAPEEYMARIHIPIITNEDCVHICEGEHLHMPADGGVYMIWVNNWHQIRNDSKKDRYHIIMDAYDTKHLTQNFRYNGDITKLEKKAQDYRSKIDAAELTEEDIKFFDNLKEEFIKKIPYKT